MVGPADDSELELPYTAAGVSVNSTSDSLDITGKPTADASSAVITWLTDSGCGTAHTNYKLRDWLFARQRYWGEPFPVVYPEDSDDVVPGTLLALCNEQCYILAGYLQLENMYLVERTVLTDNSSN